MQGDSVARRLLEYKNILKKLKGLGFKRVYSSNLADTIGISSSLVRLKGQVNSIATDRLFSIAEIKKIDLLAITSLFDVLSPVTRPVYFENSRIMDDSVQYC